MATQNRNLVQSLGLATFGALLSIIVMFVTFGFKKGKETEKIETHEIKIIALDEKKLNKETFIRFESRYKDDKLDFKDDIKEIKELLKEIIKINKGTPERDYTD